MLANNVKLTIIKKDGKLGSECPMDDQELVIGRRATLHPAICASRSNAAWPLTPYHPHACRDPDDCHIQIRLPEVSKKQAKILRDDEHGQVQTCPQPHTQSARASPQPHNLRRTRVRNRSGSST